MASQSRKKTRATKAKAILESLVASATTVEAPHQWRDLADLISEHDGIMSTTSSTFTVAVPGGSLKKEIEGGWTEKHYEFLMPVLSAVSEPEFNKAMIAKAVLMSTLRQLGCAELD